MTQSRLEFDVQTYSSKALGQLLSAPVPDKTDSYTPIGHKTIIDNTVTVLNDLGFKIKTTHYRSSLDGYVGQGQYHLQYGDDSEMGLMVAWQNSYNKLISFKYAVGAHVFVCSNGVVAGDLGSYKRKHTGDADQEAFGKMESYLGEAASIFDQLIKDREQLKRIELSPRQMAEMMGRMFIQEQIITSTQINIMKRELEKPTYDYGVPVENAWSLYNYATYAFKEDSPRNWMKRHVDLHEFFNNEFMSGGQEKPTTPTTPVPSAKIEVVQLSDLEKMIDLF